MKKSFYPRWRNGVAYGRRFMTYLRYHIIWCTTNMQNVFSDRQRNEMVDYMKATAEAMEVHLVSLVVNPNYVHLVLDSTPEIRLSDAIKIFKGNSSKWFFRDNPGAKETVPEGKLWRDTYFISIDCDNIDALIQEFLEKQKVPKKKRDVSEAEDQ